ncbi:MAG: GNAT family N-acetyltransferase [Gammaproteobacteria bacterium]|nr:GNAT family N-acetyltransferase [Gammaproteobacteria bacterium]
MRSDNLAGATSSVAPYSVEWLSDLADIERLEPMWRALESRVSDRTVFVTWDYLITWYRHYGGIYGEPLVGVARKGDDLVGIAPLVVRRSTVGRIPVRRVDFACYDGEAGEFLIVDDNPEAAGELVGSAVKTMPFDVIRLSNFTSNSAKLDSVEQAAREQGLRLHREDYAYATVDLKSGYDAYYRSMGRNFRRNLKRMDERLAGIGQVRIEGARIGCDQSMIEPVVQRLFAIEAESWKAVKRGYPLAAHHRRFIQEIGERFGPQGKLDIAILTIGGVDAAYLMALMEHGVYYDVTISYSEKFSAASPGTYLMLLLMAELPSRGVHTVVSHGPHAYKKRWATAFVSVCNAYIFGKSLRARASRFNRYVLAPLLNRTPVREWV